MPARFDVIIVGAGPAGLSAALVLARARRRVVICDDGRPRNAASRGLHAYLTRDGIVPRELLRLGRAEVRRYGARLRRGRVVSASSTASGFRAVLENGTRLESRRMLLATGVVDRIPAIPGIEPLYGRSVHHCPYCDGWQWRDRRLAVYGKGHGAAGLALLLLTWSRDVVLCTDGTTRLAPQDRAELDAARIAVESRRIGRLAGRNGRLTRIAFVRGGDLPRDALFFSTSNHPRSPLAGDLGCRLTRRGSIWSARTQCTSIPGLYAAGDATIDVQLAIVAAAEGAKAGRAIHQELADEERAARRRRARPAPRGARNDGPHDRVAVRGDDADAPQPSRSASRKAAP